MLRANIIKPQRRFNKEHKEKKRKKSSVFLFVLIFSFPLLAFSSLALQVSACKYSKTTKGTKESTEFHKGVLTKSTRRKDKKKSIVFLLSTLSATSLHYPQLRIIQHDLFFAIQFKLNSGNGIMCCAFHLHYFAKTKFLVLYFLTGL